MSYNIVKFLILGVFNLLVTVAAM